MSARVGLFLVSAHGPWWDLDAAAVERFLAWRSEPDQGQARRMLSSYVEGAPEELLDPQFALDVAREYFSGFHESEHERATSMADQNVMQFFDAHDELRSAGRLEAADLLRWVWIERAFRHPKRGATAIEVDDVSYWTGAEARRLGTLLGDLESPSHALAFVLEAVRRAARASKGVLIVTG